MKKIFITVDVECHSLDNVNAYIWGEINGERYGLEKILSTAEELNVPINFFVDVAEAYRYGDSLVKEIIKKIKDKGQPVFFHLHPNYVTGDDSKSYFWQYEKKQAEEIFSRAYKKYIQMVGTREPIVFRMGRYGVNYDFYQMLQREGIKCIDLSYIYGNDKMCHLRHDECSTKNKVTSIAGQTLLPNTSYVGFSLFGRKKYFTMDVAQTCRKELIDVVANTPIKYGVITMHVWDFFDRYFFTKKITPQKKNIRKLKYWVEKLRNEGIEFERLDRTLLEIQNESDIVYDPFEKGMYSKIKYLWYNFIRFGGIAKKNKKYFVVYSLGIVVVVIAVAILFGVQLW